MVSKGLSRKVKKETLRFLENLRGKLNEGKINYAEGKLSYHQRSAEGYEFALREETKFFKQKKGEHENAAELVGEQLAEYRRNIEGNKLGFLEKLRINYAEGKLSYHQRSAREYETASREKTKFFKQKKGEHENAAELVGEQIARMREEGDQSSHRGLEGTITSILLLMGGLFLISGNLTGYSVANLSQLESNWFGVSLLILGIILAFVYFKRR